MRGVLVERPPWYRGGGELRKVKDPTGENREWDTRECQTLRGPLILQRRGYRTVSHEAQLSIAIGAGHIHDEVLEPVVLGV